MDGSAVDKKKFQEARTKPPKVRHGGSGDSAAFSCVLCNWLLSIPYQSYCCGDRACYNCLELLAQNMKRSGCKTITCPGLGCGCGKKIAPDQFFPDKAVTRELNTLHVVCPNEGCSWEGKYSDYEEHCHSVPCSEGHAVTDMQPLQGSSYDGTFIWTFRELTRWRRDAISGNIISLYSAPFFTSRHGYKLCLRVYLNGDGSGRGTHVSFFITLMKGEFDPLLPWPFKQTVSLSLLAQDGKSRDITQSFKPDEDSSSFQMPKSEMNVASGCPQFCSLVVLDNPAYVQNDTIYLKGAISL